MSASASQEIAILTDAIRADVDSAAREFARGRAEADSGVKDGHKASESLKTIREKIDSVNSEVKTAVQSVETLRCSVDQVNHSFDSVREYSEKNDSFVQTFMAVSEETAAQASEVNRLVSEQLMQIGEFNSVAIQLRSTSGEMGALVTGSQEDLPSTHVRAA